MENKENGVVEPHHMEIDHSRLSSPNSSYGGDAALDRGPTSFSQAFRRETLGKYLEEVWPMVKFALALHGISCTLNLVEGSMTVSRTRRTRDKTFFVKARGVLELLSSGVPAPKAIKVLKRGVQHDIIKIGYQKGGLCRESGIEKEQFLRRRKYLMDTPSKDIFEFTGCKVVFIKGPIVAGIGPRKGLMVLNWLVKSCMVDKVRPKRYMKAAREVDDIWHASRLNFSQLLEDFSAVRF